jgi:hypothetical protein
MTCLKAETQTLRGRKYVIGRDWGSQEWVRAVLGHDTVGLGLLGLVLVLELILHVVVLVGQPLLGLKRDDAARS